MLLFFYFRPVRPPLGQMREEKYIGKSGFSTKLSRGSSPIPPTTAKMWPDIAVGHDLKKTYRHRLQTRWSRCDLDSFVLWVENGFASRCEKLMYKIVWIWRCWLSYAPVSAFGWRGVCIPPPAPVT